MPSFTSTTLLTTLSALALTASVCAVPIAIPTPVGAVARAQPTGWATGYLEDYATYHVRYLALDCQTQHNTTFFSTCCHPLLAAESLTTRPDECTPTDEESSSVSVSLASKTAAATASVTGTATGSAYDAEETDEADEEADDIYCDDSTSVAAVVSSVAAAIASTATESVSVVTLVSSYTAAATGTESASAAAVTETIAVVAQNFVQSASSSEEWSSSSTKAKWTPSTSSSAWTPASTSSTAPAATSTASSSGGSGTTYTGGEATYFYQNGNAGECGTVHSDSDYIIAIDSNGWWPDYQTNAASPYCGKSIVITNTNNGKSVTAVVADVCPTCVSDNSLDLSWGAFTAIASESDGMVPISWQWA